MKKLNKTGKALFIIKSYRLDLVVMFLYGRIVMIEF